VREGSGTGEAKALSPGQAHELALKSAETDATKRALASFGNVFGLALYDREQSGVKKTSNGRCSGPDEIASRLWVLRSSSGETLSTFEAPNAFADALRKMLKEAGTAEELFSIWEHNVRTVRLLHRLYRRHSGRDGTDGTQLVLHLNSAQDVLERLTQEPMKPQSPDQNRAPPPHLPSPPELTRASSQSANQSAFALKNTSALSRSSLLDLRPHSLTRASHSVCPAERPRAQGQR
jgi:hypothetical protein